MSPVLAISLGDPAGISPEIVARSLNVACDVSRPVIFGHWESFFPFIKSLEKMPDIALVDEFQLETEGIQFVHCGPKGHAIKNPNYLAAVAQFEALERAVEAVHRGHCHGIVTGPVSKSLVAMVSDGFTGHTEYLARRFGVSPWGVTMVFAGTKLAVGLLATHVPLKDVPTTINVENLQRTVDHLAELSRALYPGKRPRIGVAALNPHGGEDGLIGTEEEEIIRPFCETHRERHDVHVVGPIPADTLFRNALEGEYDGVVAAYHDQALIPLRLFGVGKMVNITMGLPIVRTSPDHGVAYDIVGKNLANPAGMQLAIQLAAKMAIAKKST